MKRGPRAGGAPFLIQLSPNGSSRQIMARVQLDSRCGNKHANQQFTASSSTSLVFLLQIANEDASPPQTAPLHCVVHQRTRQHREHASERGPGRACGRGRAPTSWRPSGFNWCAGRTRVVLIWRPTFEAHSPVDSRLAPTETRRQLSIWMASSSSSQSKFEIRLITLTLVAGRALARSLPSIEWISFVGREKERGNRELNARKRSLASALCWRRWLLFDLGLWAAGGCWLNKRASLESGPCLFNARRERLAPD